MQIIILTILCIIILLIIISKRILNETFINENGIIESFITTADIENTYKEYKKISSPLNKEKIDLSKEDLNKIIPQLIFLKSTIIENSKNEINNLTEQINISTDQYNKIKNDKTKKTESNILKKQIADFVSQKNTYNKYIDLINNEDNINFITEYTDRYAQYDKEFDLQTSIMDNALNTGNISDISTAYTNLDTYTKTTYYSNIDSVIKELNDLINDKDMKNKKKILEYLINVKTDYKLNINAKLLNYYNAYRKIQAEIAAKKAQEAAAAAAKKAQEEAAAAAAAAKKAQEEAAAAKKAQEEADAKKAQDEAAKKTQADAIANKKKHLANSLIMLPTYDALKYINKEQFDTNPRTGLYLINKNINNFKLDIYDIETDTITNIDICSSLPISALAGPSSTCKNNRTAFYLKVINDAIKTNDKYFSTMYKPDRIFTMKANDNGFEYNIYDNNYYHIMKGNILQYNPSLKASSRYNRPFNKNTGLYHICSYLSNIVLFGNRVTGTFIFVIPINTIIEDSYSDIDIIPILVPSPFQLPGNMRLENPGIIPFNNKLYIIGGAYGNTNDTGSPSYNNILVLNEDINFDSNIPTPGLKWTRLDMHTGGANPKKVGVLNTIPFIYNNTLYITGLEINDTEDYTNTNNSYYTMLYTKPQVSPTNQNYIYKYNEENNVFFERKNFTQTSICTIKPGSRQLTCNIEDQIIIPIF